MNTVRNAGTVLTAVGLVGYAIGVLAPYPGRSVSIAGVMAGITLAAIGQWGAPEATGQ